MTWRDLAEDVRAELSATGHDWESSHLTPYVLGQHLSFASDEPSIGQTWLDAHDRDGRAEAWRRLRAAGCSDLEIERRTGVGRRVIARALSEPEREAARAKAAARVRRARRARAA